MVKNRAPRSCAGLRLAVTSVAAHLTRPIGILPLIVLRIAFGSLMLATTLRFVAKGWVQELFVDPQIHFTYLGFGWIKPLPGAGMYWVFAAIALASLCIALGFRYRLSMTLFFLLFTYVELIDVTYYLNHYYFISVFSFILIWLPLDRSFSLDERREPHLKRDFVPAWTIYVVRLQLGIVYFYAGVAKLNPDWLLEAMPLRIWLAANAGMPGVGPWFDKLWVAYMFSWAGLIFDISVPFLLSWRWTRLPAYAAVVVFHTMTAMLFDIGMFPWIMIGCTLVFFTHDDYRRAGQWWNRLILRRLGQRSTGRHESGSLHGTSSLSLRMACYVLPVFMLVQMLMPLRHWAYTGNVHWTEEGFRFAWKVMVMEKTGYTIFHIAEPVSGRRWSVFPEEYLTPFQVQQMTYQPDMILEFAHFLAIEQRRPGMGPLEVRAEAYVSLNGRASRLLIDPTANLVEVNDGLSPKTWVLH